MNTDVACAVATLTAGEIAATSGSTNLTSACCWPARSGHATFA
jgi:hypothetical protein